LVLEAAVRDVVREPPAVCSFDVIVVSRFLERSLAPAIVKALRPDGLLFYQTFIRDAVGQGGPRKPDFRLGTNELLQLFASLTVLVYREEGTRGDTTEGFRDEAMLVAARPFDL
jgi:SAM-dependent methyltransferase